jgi:thymidine kinase
MTKKIASDALAMTKPMSYFKVITGPMFSGKTEELIRVLKRSKIAGKDILVMKPAIDSRSGHEIISRHQPDLAVRQFKPQSSFDAIPVASASEALGLIQTHSPSVIGVDEAQFFGVWMPGFLEELLCKYAETDFMVVAAGLDLDAWKKPFGIMPQLMAIADEVQKETAICFVCSKPAMFTQKLAAGIGQVEVGDAEIYEARCRACHTIPA